MLAALLYEHSNYGGYTFGVEYGQNYPALAPPIGSGSGQASSMYIYGPQWITFWESPNYHEGDDSLWVHPPPIGYIWTFDDLHRLNRPHGNNHWGDRIRCISFSGAPTGSNENRTIVRADGSVISGDRLFTSDEIARDRGCLISLVSLNSSLVPTES
jgi:hypothetical protein